MVCSSILLFGKKKWYKLISKETNLWERELCCNLAIYFWTFIVPLPTPVLMHETMCKQLQNYAAFMLQWWKFGTVSASFFSFVFWEYVYSLDTRILFRVGMKMIFAVDEIGGNDEWWFCIAHLLSTSLFMSLEGLHQQISPAKQLMIIVWANDFLTSLLLFFYASDSLSKYYGFVWLFTCWMRMDADFLKFLCKPWLLSSTCH